MEEHVPLSPHPVVGGTQPASDTAASIPQVVAAPNSLAEVLISRQVFLSSYISFLLPALRRIHGEPVSSTAVLTERLSAVQRAAKVSLVASAGSSTAWSQALLKELVSTSTCSLLNVHPSEAGRRSKKTDGDSSLRKKKCGCLALLKKRTRGRSCRCGRIVSKIGFSLAGGVVPACTGLLQNAGNDHARSTEASRPCVGRNSRRRARICKGALFCSYLRVLRATRTKRQAQTSLPREREEAIHEAQPYHHQYSSPLVPTFKVQIDSLRALVPGGRYMDVPLLLKEAADYIVSLQLQIEALQSLSHSLRQP